MPADIHTAAQLAALIDHTLLAPETGPEAAAAAVAEADHLGTAAVCLAPTLLPVHPRRARVCTVIGFPSGTHHPLIKAMEARLAVEQGATELDVVINYGAVLAHGPDAVIADLVPVREAVPGVTLKAIVESAALYQSVDDVPSRPSPQADELLRRTCDMAVRAGADFVKTSTGFHPAGGATVHAVEVMRAAVPAHIGVKASGGIRTAEHALAFLRAGATRLGTSRTADILAEL